MFVQIRFFLLVLILIDIVELGAWNLPRHQIFRTYIREYQRHFERSEPKEDFEDRLILYRQ